MLALILGGLAVLVGLLLVGTITFRVIRRFINDAKIEHPKAKTATVIKRKLRNGKYRVVSGVFGPRGGLLESQAWEGEDIDSDLSAEFGRKSTIVYDVR